MTIPISACLDILKGDNISFSDMIGSTLVVLSFFIINFGGKCAQKKEIKYTELGKFEIEEPEIGLPMTITKSASHGVELSDLHKHSV